MWVCLVLTLHIFHLALSLWIEGIIARTSLVKCCLRRKIASCVMKSDGMRETKGG